MTPLRLIHSAAPSEQPKPSARPPLRVVQQGPCPCRDPSCIAQTLWAQRDPDYVQMAKRCFDRVRANPGDIRPHEDGTWQEMTSTRGWLLVDVVTIEGVDLDGNTIGSIAYTVRRLPSGYEVRPLPGQSITDADAEHYRDAAIGQWELRSRSIR